MRLEAVGKRYGVRQPWVVRDVSADVAGGRLIRVEGPNGSGKSTLLRAGVPAARGWGYDAERWRSSRALRYSATTMSVSSSAEVSELRLSRVILPPWIRFTRSHTSSTWP